MEPVNRIEIVLFEKSRTSKWLSEQMGVTPSTVYKCLATRPKQSSENIRLVEV